MDGGRRPAQRPTSLNLPAFAAWKHSLSVSLDSEQGRRPRWASAKASTDQSPNMEPFSPTRSKGSEANDRPSWSNSWSVISNNRRQSTGLDERKSPKVELFSPTRRRGSASADSADRPVRTSNWNAANKNRGQSTDLIDSSNASSRRQPKTAPKAELLSPTRRRGSASVEANDRPRWTNTWGVTSMNRRQSADLLDDHSLSSRSMSDTTAKADLFSPTRRRGSATVDVSNRPSWTSTWSVTSMNRRQSADILDDHSPSSRRMSDATAKADLFSPTRRRGSATVDVSDRPSWTSTWSVTSMNRRQSADILDDHSPSSRMSDATAKADLFSPTRRRGSATVDVSDRPSWTSTWSVTSMNRRQSADILDDHSPSSRRMSDATAKADLFSPTRRRGSATVDVSDRPSWTSTWSVTSMNRRQSADILDDHSSSSRRMSDATGKAELFSPTRRRGSATVDAGDRPSWTSTWSIASKNRRQSADLTDGSKSDVSSRQEGFSATRRRGSESTGISDRPSWASSRSTLSKNRRNSMELSSTPGRLTDAALKLQRLSPTRVREPQGVVMGHGQTWTQTDRPSKSLTRDREGERGQATRSESIGVHPLSTHIPDDVSADKFDGQETPETPRDRNRQEDDSDLGPHRDEREGSEMRPRDRQPSPDSDADDGPVESQDSMGREMRTWNGVDDVRESENETNVGRSTTLSDHWSQQHWMSLQTPKNQIETDVNQGKPNQNHVVPQFDYSNHEETVVPQRQLGGWMEQKTMSSKNELDKEKNLSILVVQGSESDEDTGHKIPPVISPPKPHDAMFHENLVPVIPTTEPEDTWSQETLVVKQTPLQEDRVLRQSELDENCEHKFSAITQKELFQEFVNENQMPESESQEITLNEIDHDHEILVNPLNKHDHDSWYEISVVDDTRNENQIELDKCQNPDMTTFPQTESDKDLNQKELVMELDELDEKSANEISITSLTEFDEVESLENSEFQGNVTNEDKGHEIPTVDTRTESHKAMINKNAARVIPISESDDAWTQETPAFQQTQLHEHQVRESTVLQQPELDKNWMRNVSVIAQEELFQDLLNEYRVNEIASIPRTEANIDSNLETLTSPPEYKEESGLEVPVVYDASNEPQVELEECHSHVSTIPQREADEDRMIINLVDSQLELDDDTLMVQNNGMQNDCINEILTISIIESEDKDSMNENLVLASLFSEEDGKNSKGNTLVLQADRDEDPLVQQSELHDDCSHEFQATPQTEPDRRHEYPILLSSASEQAEEILLQTEASNCDIQTVAQNEMVKEWKDEENRDYTIYVVSQNELEGERAHETTKVLQNESDKDRTHKNLELVIPETDLDQNPEIYKPELNEDNITTVTELLEYWSNENPAFPQTELLDYRLNEIPIDPETELPKYLINKNSVVQKSEFNKDWRRDIQISPQIKLDENIVNVNQVVLQTELGEDNSYNITTVLQNKLHESISRETLVLPQTEPDKDKSHKNMEMLICQTEQDECTVNDNLTIPQYLVNCGMHHQNPTVLKGESYYTSKKETPNELVENLSHQSFMVQPTEEDEATKNSRIQMLETKLVDMTTETERLQALSKQLTSELHEVRGELASTEQALLTIKMELSETNERHQKMTDELSSELNAKSNILEATFREIKLILTERRRNKEWMEGNITDERSAREIVGQVKEVYLSLEKENETLTTTVNELEDELSWEDRASVQASMETLHQNLRNTKHKIEVLQEEQARKNQIIECLKEEQRMERESYDFKLQHLQEENTTLHEKLADVKEKLYKAECTLMENKQLKPKINSDTYSVEEKNGETRDNNQTCSSEEVKIHISQYNTGTDILSTLEMLRREKEELSQRLEESREEADNLLRCQRERHEADLEELLEDKQNEVNELKVQTDAQVLKLTTEKQTLEELLAASQKEREKLQDIIIKLDQAQTQLQESVIQAIDKSVTPTEKEMKIYYNFNHSTESTIETDDTHCLHTETSANEYEPIFNFTETQDMETIHDDKMKSDQKDTKNKIITKHWELAEAIETNGMAKTQRVDNATNVCQDTIYTVKGNKDDGRKHVTFLIPGTKEGQTITHNEQITFSRQGGRLQHSDIETTGAHFVWSEDSEALIETLSSEKRELEQQLALTRMTLSAMDRQFRELQESESKLWREREASVQVVHKLVEKVELQQQSLEQHGGCEGAFYREKAESLSAYVQQLQAELNKFRREAADPD